MSNAHSERRRAATAVESLENRTLFAATAGPSFAAILGQVQEVAADHLRLAEHAELSAGNLSAARQAAADAARNGKALIAADKAAVKSAKGDAAAAFAAQERLALDAARVRADVLAAKANVKSLRAQAKATAAALKADFKEGRALLGAEMKSSDAAARKAVGRLLADWQAVQAGGDLTSADVQALADDLRVAADGATQPSVASVNTLRANTLFALSDGDLSDDESTALLGDLKNVFLTSDIPDAEAEAIVDDIAVIMEKLTVAPADLAVILRDVELTVSAFSGA
jgi:hypothetical protein